MLRTMKDETKKKKKKKKKKKSDDSDSDSDDDRGGTSKAANEKFEKAMKSSISCLTVMKTPYLHKLATVTAEDVENYSQGSQLLVEDDEGWLVQEDDRNWDVARYLLYCELSTLA
jgi:hypothetical protein